MSRHSLLTIIVSPALEDALVDWLLDQLPDVGFSSFPIRGHSNRHAGLSLAEQVTGRRNQIRFDVQLPDERLSLVVERLKADFANAGLHYWIAPLREFGAV